MARYKRDHCRHGVPVHSVVRVHHLAAAIPADGDDFNIDHHGEDGLGEIGEDGDEVGDVGVP